MTSLDQNSEPLMGDGKQIEIDPETDVDNILRSLGRTGKFQILQLFLIMLFILENSFHLVSIVYIAYRPEYRCQDINVTVYNTNTHPEFTNVSYLTSEYKKCEIEFSGNVSGSTFHYHENCINGYNYSIPKDRTTVTEWDLVCDGAERSEFGQTLIMIGQAMGAVLFSPLADKIGRKPSNLLARNLFFLTALATVFSPNIYAFLAFRFLQGTFQGGSVMTSTILYTEVMPKELRHRAEGLSMVGWTTGLVLTSMIGYLCRNISWRYMQLILALITCHALFDWLFYDESIRWLVANGKTERVKEILKKAAKMNNVSLEKVMENVKYKTVKKEVTNDDVTIEVEKTMPKTKYNILTILKSKHLLCTSVILWIAWITNTLTYYGLMLTTSKLSGDRYLNNIIASMAEFPVVIVQQLLINRIGRKWMLIIFHALAGVSMVVAMLCSTYGESDDRLAITGTVFSFIGRFAITGSFSSVFLYTSEIYPTNIRNTGLGMASTISRLGSMLSPFAMTLSDYVEWGPTAIFAAMNMFVTVSLCPMPETMDRELPTTLSELKLWYKDNKGCNFNIKKDKYDLKDQRIQQ